MTTVTLLILKYAWYHILNLDIFRHVWQVLHTVWINIWSKGDHWQKIPLKLKPRFREAATNNALNITFKK